LDERSTVGLTRYLPHVLVATLVVAVLPVAAVWVLLDAGILHSVLLSVLLSMALAMAASYLGGLLWSSRPGSRDLLFSELMPWGYLRRVWVERRLTKTMRLLDEEQTDANLGPRRRGVLLAQLATALEARDPYTHGHSRRVARHSATIAKRMGLSRDEVETVRTAAVVHDVGKMSTPNEVLRKPGELTDAEFDVIKQHSARGAEMVSTLGNDELTAIVRHHHERLDGTGYPDGLAGSAIPLGARIIAVADTFDAITSNRPYRAPRTHRAAIAILNEQAGSRLDPDAVRAFQSNYAGHRSLAAWVALTSVPQRLVAWLGGGVNVATGSAARVVATSALTGAAAVTAVVDNHRVTTTRVARHHASIAASAVSSRSAAAGAVQVALGAAVQPAVTVHLAPQNPQPAASVLVAAQRQAVQSAPAPVQVIGAVGVTATPAIGSATRGINLVSVTGQGRGAGGGGLGGQGFGGGRVLTVPGGSQAQSGGSGGQTEGAPTRGQGGGEGAPGQGGDPVQTGGSGGSTTTTTGDGQTTGGGDRSTSGGGDQSTSGGGGDQSTSGGGDQSTSGGGGDQSTSGGGGDQTTPPPSDSQTPPPTETAPPPPTDPQTPPTDSSTWSQGAGGDQTTGGSDSSSTTTIAPTTAIAASDTAQTAGVDASSGQAQSPTA
jgi:putative nucleotidyltransferase with HDIG domain